MIESKLDALIGRDANPDSLPPKKKEDRVMQVGRATRARIDSVFQGQAKIAARLKAVQPTQ